MTLVTNSMTVVRLSAAVSLMVIASMPSVSWSESYAKQSYIWSNETFVCGVVWKSGRWRTPVAVLLKAVDETQWVGWVDFRVYDVAAIELEVKQENSGRIVLEGDTDYGTSYVIVLNGGDVDIRMRNFDSGEEDSASGVCRFLARAKFVIEAGPRKQN